MTKGKGPRPKHIPQRTCFVCRQEQGKRELVRIVRTPEGAVRLDPTGKAAGRGAYLCKVRKCWEAPGLQQRLGAALKTTISSEDMAALRVYAAALPGDVPIRPEPTAPAVPPSADAK